MTLGGLADYYEKDVPPVFAAVDDPALQEEFREANAAAAGRCGSSGAWFRDADRRRRRTPANFALGAERFSRMLRETERVDIPLDGAGGGRPARPGAQPRRAARGLRRATRPGRRWRSAGRVQAEKPRGRAGRGGAPAARRACAGSSRSSELVTIPGTEEARVAESPPYQRWNCGVHRHPRARTTRHLPSIYYISPPDPAWSPEEQAAYIPGEADLLFVTVHEVWPGHFLQFLHSQPRGVGARAAVRRLRLRRGLGPLLRGDDVGGRASATAIPGCTSASSRTRCCATCATSSAIGPAHRRG